MTKTNDPKHDATDGGRTPRASVAAAVAYADYQRLLGGGPSFWDALISFRASLQLDPEPLDIDSRTFPRDKSPGRPVDLT